MTKLRSKASVVIAAAAIAIGPAITLTTVAAPPASAATCYLGYVFNRSSTTHWLDDYGGGSGTYVHTYPFTGSNNQYWCLEKASEGGYYFHPKNNLGLCLDAHTYNPGQPIWVYTCNGTLAQRWCWNLTGYIVTAGNFNVALKDNGLYDIVDIQQGTANKWGWDSYAQPPPDQC